MLLGVLVMVVSVRLFGMQAASAYGNDEAVEFGTLPDHLRSGLVAPLAAYKPQPNEGGALVFGACCAPILAVAGSTFHGMRLCGLVWHASMAMVFGLLAVWLGGWRAGLLLGVLWAVAPPSIMEISHRGWVNHLEPVLLSGIAIACAGAAFGPRSGRRRYGLSAAAGGAAGLSVYFQQSALMVLVVVGLAVAAAHARRWGPNLGAFALGLALGLAPFLTGGGYWDRPDWDEHSFSGGEAGIQVAQNLASRTSELLQQQLPQLWSFRAGWTPRGDPRPSSEEWGLLWWMGALTLVMIGAVRLWRHRSDDPRPLWLFGVAVAAVVGHLTGCILSGLSLNEGRYLVPIWPFVVLAAAAAVGDETRRAGAVVAVAAAAAVLVPSLAHLISSTQELPRDGRRQFERQLRSHRVERNEGLREWLLAAPTEARTRAFEEHPRDRFALARIHGIAQGRASLNDANWERAGLPPFSRNAWEQGLGEEMAEQGVVPDADASGAVWLGWAVKLVDREHYPSAVERPVRPLCLAYGLSAHRAPVGGLKEAFAEAGCPPGLFAMGFGIGVARASVFDREESQVPRMSWWDEHRDATEEQQAAFACGFVMERGVLVSDGDSTAPSPVDGGCE